MSTDAEHEKNESLQCKNSGSDSHCRDDQSAGQSGASWSAARAHSRSALHNPWARQTLPHPLGRTNLIAYIRPGNDNIDALRQLQVIEGYCASHGYRLEKVFEDEDKPSVGLASALEALRGADGLIAVDLDRFVQHEGDKTRDLRPLIHEFFSLGSKHLITIKEGIDTGSPSGQASAIELINQPRDHGLDLP